MIGLGFLLIGLGFSSNLLTRTVALLLFTTTLFTFGEMISMPVTGAYVADLAPADRRGLYMGTYGMVWAAAFVFGPSLGMCLFGVSRTALWLSCGVLGIIAAALISAPVGARPTTVLGNQTRTEKVPLAAG